LHELFTRPTVRFFAGFIFVCFFGMPVVMLLFGFPTSFWFVVPFVLVGIAGGIFWVRKPPEIFYKLPPEPHTTGMLRTPAARFVGGFLVGCLIFMPTMWIIQGGRIDLSELGPMTAVGIVCGLMSARRSAVLFWSARKLKS
jgi:hypothetical protein